MYQCTLTKTHGHIERLLLIEQFVDFQENRQFENVKNLYTEDLRDKLKTNKNVSDKKLKEYINGMRKFKFYKEKQTTRKALPMWVLSYQHQNKQKQFIVYYLIKEDNLYKILDQRTLTQP